MCSPRVRRQKKNGRDHTHRDLKKLEELIMMETLRRWRADWRYPTTLLCLYGFFSTVKPMEPFLIPYMTGPDKNLTSEQVNNQIFPVWTYSYLAVQVPVFLLTDWLRYKPMVVFQCIILFTTSAMLLWLKSVAAMQAMQFFYGVVTASEVAYFTYIYSVVDLKRYRKVTSYCRCFQLLGYTVGAVLGQLIVSFNIMSFDNTMALTLALIAVAFPASLLLPMPQQSMFFHRRDTEKELDSEDPERSKAGTEDKVETTSKSEHELGEEELEKSGGQEDEAGKGTAEDGPKAEELEGSGGAQSCGNVLLQLWKDFLHCYSSRRLLYWSLWWAMATCGYNQTTNYVQLLWEHVQPSQDFSIYNGAVEAVSFLLSAATAYGIGFIEVQWEQWGELALGGFSGLGAGALFLMTFSGNIWLCYTGYVIFKCLYMLLITIAMYQIAAGLSMERYALVFGANNFGALVLQTIITSVVVDSRGLSLGIIPQFTVYASYFSVIAVIFSLRGLYTIWRTQRNSQSLTVPDKNDSPASYKDIEMKGI